MVISKYKMNCSLLTVLLAKRFSNCGSAPVVFGKMNVRVVIGITVPEGS